MAIMDAVELYYVKDLRSKRWTGVRWSKEKREEMAMLAWFERMQFVVLKLILKRGRK